MRWSSMVIAIGIIKNKNYFFYNMKCKDVLDMKLPVTREDFGSEDFADPLELEIVLDTRRTGQGHSWVTR